MKPLHIGLLVVGAALAGGLAVKMTELPSVPSAPPLPPVAVKRATPPASAPIVLRKDTASVIAAKVETLQLKKSPVADQVAAAPAPVYLQPSKVQPWKPAVRKNKPILIARAAPPATNLAPLLVPPVPYEAPPKADPAPPDPQPTAAPERQALPDPALPSAPPRQVTLPAGTTVPVRMNESLSSDRAIAGDTFNASLSEPLILDGLVIAERGAPVRGRIVGTQKAGRISGTSSLDLELTSVMTSDGQEVAISTSPWTKRGEPSYRQDAAKIGGGAALGAIIGGIAGGGKGAAIGAGAGSVLGAGAVASTRGKPANISTETIIRFRLTSEVTITERQL